MPYNSIFISYLSQIQVKLGFPCDIRQVGLLRYEHQYYHLVSTAVPLLQTKATLCTESQKSKWYYYFEVHWYETLIYCSFYLLAMRHTSTIDAHVRYPT